MVRLGPPLAIVLKGARDSFPDKVGEPFLPTSQKICLLSSPFSICTKKMFGEMLDRTGLKAKCVPFTFFIAEGRGAYPEGAAGAAAHPALYQEGQRGKQCS